MCEGQLQRPLRRAQMVEARRLVAAEAAAGAPDALAPVTNIVYMGMGAPPSICRGPGWQGRHATPVQGRSVSGQPGVLARTFTACACGFVTWHAQSRVAHRVRDIRNSETVVACIEHEGRKKH